MVQRTCINFHKNRVSRSVKTVHINLFAKNCNFNKFVTTNSNFANIDYFGHESSNNVGLHVYQFSAKSV